MLKQKILITFKLSPDRLLSCNISISSRYTFFFSFSTLIYCSEGPLTSDRRRPMTRLWNHWKGIYIEYSLKRMKGLQTGWPQQQRQPQVVRWLVFIALLSLYLFYCQYIGVFVLRLKYHILPESVIQSFNWWTFCVRLMHKFLKKVLLLYALIFS